MKRKRKRKVALRSPSVAEIGINVRTGKHHQIVSQILNDLLRLDEYAAIRLDLTKLGMKKATLRTAIHRAAKKQKLHLATTSDEKHVLVFLAVAD